MTPKEAKEIRAKCTGMVEGLSSPHPLDGKSVAEWVREARRGWPRPIPYSSNQASALKRIQEHADLEEMTTEHPRPGTYAWGAS